MLIIHIRYNLGNGKMVIKDMTFSYWTNQRKYGYHYVMDDVGTVN